MRTFVVHYRKLVDRRRVMDLQLREHGLEADYVDWFDRDTVDAHDLSMFDRRRRGWRMRRVMSNVQVSITLSHLHCIREAASETAPCLVLEDDAVLAPDFRARLDGCMSQLPADWEALFVGDGCGLHIPKEMQREGQLAYAKGPERTDWGGKGATRCMDSYLLHPKGAARVVAHLAELPGPIDKPVDWWMNDVIRRIGLRVWWAEPTMCSQSSQAEGGARCYRERHRE